MMTLFYSVTGGNRFIFVDYLKEGGDLMIYFFLFVDRYIDIRYR